MLPVDVDSMPTTQMLSLATAPSPYSLPLNSALGTADQLAPSQCSISGPVMLLPTAHTSLAATAVTSYRLPPPTSGLGTALHVLPFQCSVSPWPEPYRDVAECPTTHPSLAVTAATPFSMLNDELPLGLGTALHTAPFQRR